MPTGFCSCLSAAPETTHSSCVLFGWSSKSRRKSLAHQVCARHLSIGRVNHESISLSQVSLNLYLVWNPKMGHLGGIWSSMSGTSWEWLLLLLTILQQSLQNSSSVTWKEVLHTLYQIPWVTSVPKLFLGSSYFLFYFIKVFFFFSMASAKITCYC